MDILKPNILKPALRKIGLNKPSLLSAGKSHGGKVKPYIKGHVTDGSSTFTFKVNNADVTVPVDANGNWKWVATTTVTSLYSAFENKTYLDSVTFKNLENCTNCLRTFSGCSVINNVIIDNSFEKVSAFDYFFNSTGRNKIVTLKNTTISEITGGSRFLIGCEDIIGIENCEFKKLNDGTQMFYNFSGKTLNLSNADFRNLTTTTNMFSNATNLENINIKYLSTNMSFGSSFKLTEQSVVNIFNAVAADDITLTFHATVYAYIQAQLEIEDSPIYTAYWDSDYDFTIASA